MLPRLVQVSIVMALFASGTSELRASLVEHGTAEYLTSWDTSQESLPTQVDDHRLSDDPVGGMSGVSTGNGVSAGVPTAANCEPSVATRPSLCWTLEEQRARLPSPPRTGILKPPRGRELLLV